VKSAVKLPSVLGTDASAQMHPLLYSYTSTTIINY